MTWTTGALIILLWLPTTASSVHTCKGSLKTKHIVIIIIIIIHLSFDFGNFFQSQDNKPRMGGAPQIQRLWKSSTQAVYASYRYSNHAKWLHSVYVEQVWCFLPNILLMIFFICLSVLLADLLVYFPAVTLYCLFLTDGSTRRKVTHTLTCQDI